MFSHLGVALLLFMVGIGLNTKEIKEMGKPALLIGLSQVGLTILFG
jgi:Kef-type K+ transport system membrane component KefB